jgi:signal transduction histidine kinase
LRENYVTGGTIGQYADKNGVWLSAFQPILNSNGNVVGVLQVDEQFDEFIMEARSSILENTLYSLLFVVPISALLYFFLQTFRKLRERLDREKEEIDRLRTELFANISHDLRTPLASIQGYLETILMKKDSIEPERRDRYLSISLSNTERLRKLVDELFELSKLQSKEYKLNKEPFLLSELAKDVINEYRLEASQKGISLREDIPQDLPMISADLGMIDRVLNNLLSNALKFTPSGGTISLRVWQSGSELCISLEDTGVGISAEDLPKIWDRFHTKPAGETVGTGLGLAIVKRIFELHNAPHRVDSVPGQGTRFVFCLPVH